MVNIKEMDLDILQNNVIRRNIVIRTLRQCRSELKRIKENELDNIAFDDDHLAFDGSMRRQYDGLIREIDDLIDGMKKGDWSLSVESTREREKLFPCYDCGKVGCTDEKHIHLFA